MTTTPLDDPPASGDALGGDDEVPDASAETDRELPSSWGSRRTGAMLRAAGVVSGVLAVLLLGFVVELTLLGALKHDRDQEVAYANFRVALATGTAPVGQTDGNGRLLPLGTPVAVLDVPVLGLRQVVFEGTTSGVLASGPGHVRTTVLPGQIGQSIIDGQQAAYGGPFRHIDQLVAGDTFTVTTGQGDNTFRVEDVRRAGDPEPTMPGGTSWLTLVTGTGMSYLPSGVVRVDARLISPPQPSPGLLLPPRLLPDAEQPMRGDTSVGLAVALWSLVLVVAAAAIAWARRRWGRWQSWVVGVPVLGALGLTVAHHAAQLLPNML